MSNPSVIAAYGHRYQVWLRNANLSSGSVNDIVADRVQSIEPTATHNTTKYYELGTVSAIGATTDPTQVRVTAEENLHNSEIDMYLAGVDPTTGSGYYAANMLGQANTAYVLQRNDADTIVGEIGVGNLRVSEVQYRFVINGSCTVSYTLEGTSGSYYTSGFVHPTWGSQDSAASSPGGVHGKDARISFATPGAGTKAYRLQSFTIRVAYPVEHVKELGTRQEVGVLNDTPDVTVDFDLLQADYQPHDVFFGTSDDGGVTKYNLTDPQVRDIFINVYDPELGEAASVIKSFRIDNCKPSSNSPTQARVRQLATSRWSLMGISADNVLTGGLTVSKTEITS
jgi:hypothetical protein